jgi:hypothetical protein
MLNGIINETKILISFFVPYLTEGEDFDVAVVGQDFVGSDANISKVCSSIPVKYIKRYNLYLSY